MSSKAGEIRAPGYMRTINGTLIDLCNFKEEDVNIMDIAWGLGRTLRYGGHLREDYTVAHHSVIMSYLVSDEYALEALLHDASESYMGDIIWPVKALFPEVSLFEDTLLAAIMRKYEVKTGKIITNELDGTRYIKSKAISAADEAMLQHECFSIGRPGIYIPEVEAAWLKAVEIHEQYWYAPQYVFLQRFRELTGVKDPHTLPMGKITKEWFPDEGLEDDVGAAMVSLEDMKEGELDE